MQTWAARYMIAPVRRVRRWHLLALVVLAALAGGLYMVASRSAPTAQERAHLAARRRWAARPFAAYHVVINIERVGFPSCAQEMDVRGEQVVAVRRNTCQFQDPFTVADLFTYIESQEQRTTMRTALDTCGAGMPCTREADMVVSYDERLGYPHSIDIHYSFKPNWGHPDNWWYVLSHGSAPTYNTTLSTSLFAPKRITAEVQAIQP